MPALAAFRHHPQHAQDPRPRDHAPYDPHHHPRHPYHPAPYPQQLPAHLPPPHVQPPPGYHHHPSLPYPPAWHPVPAQFLVPPPPRRVDPPPQVMQKVWILDCKSCGTFITNRGMKAVLLLRPSVALYSTDALPINCSAFSGACSAAAGAAAPNGKPLELPRTCDCLTQTLFCHGCGAAVGYMIVVPCARCTHSTSASNRTTNGHRFVFHSTEVDACERHYVAQEPGVHSSYAALSATSSNSSPRSPALSSPTTSSSSMARFVSSPMQSFEASPPTSSVGGTSPLVFAPPQSPESPMVVPSQPAARDHIRRSSHPDVIMYTYGPERTAERERVRTPSDLPDLVPVEAYTVYEESDTSFGSDGSFTSTRSGIVFPSALAAHQRLGLEERKAGEEERGEAARLEAGDVLYWHQLVRNGEIPGVVEDERARRGKEERRRARRVER